MKLKYDFAVREIAGDFVIIPLGEAALKFGGMIVTSEAGALLVNALKEEVTREALAALLMNEYEVDEATANADLEEFLDQLNGLQLLSE